MKIKMKELLKIIINIIGVLTIITTCLGGISVFTQVAWIIIGLMGVNNKFSK